MKAKADGNVIPQAPLPHSSESGLTIELDLFDTPFEDLRLAEVEFSSEEEALAFVPPPWFGEDVTWSSKYHKQHLKP